MLRANASTAVSGIAKLSNNADINAISTSTVITPVDIKAMINTRLNDASNTNLNNLLNPNDSIKMSKEVETSDFTVNIVTKKINIATKISTSISAPTINDNDTLRIITDENKFKVLASTGHLSNVPLYSNILNELRIKWGNHNVLTRIDLTQSPFYNSYS